jgi:hypothetical protein
VADSAAMPKEPAPRDPRSELASTVTDTEEGRAFFQRRLSVFGFCLFVLAGGSWVVMSSAYLAGFLPQHELFGPANLLHLANALVPGALWLVTRKQPLDARILHALDVVTSLGLFAIWGATGAVIPDPAARRFVPLLAFVLGFLARAIVVPSTPRRTLRIGVLGALLVVAFGTRTDVPFETTIGFAVGAACWAASAVTIATLASYTIYGLRREVQKARVLGQYTLESKIGEGGMGAVWRASHALLRRPTAVKLLPPEAMSDAAIRRFEREVQLTARLTHPNTVAIYDYGRTRDGIFYYAMELIEGTDLERLVLSHGPQPAERVAHLLSQVCGALGEAHDLGLVHRDVKPANVLIAMRSHEHEFSKLVDFGLVKSVKAEKPELGLTATNALTGTPLYLSPEAIQDPDSVEARSDLYALGAVAWYLLTGRPVFEGRTVVEVCALHLHEKPRRPSEVTSAEIPAELDAIVLSCLEKKPEARPADARALRTLLEGTGLAAKWTQSRAADWWRVSGKAATKVAASGPRTIALDVDDRGLSS